MVYNVSKPKYLEFRSWSNNYIRVSQYDKNCMNSVGLFTMEQYCNQ